MSRCFAFLRRVLLCLALAPSLALPLAAHAEAVEYDVFFGGMGDLVFDPVTSTGAWTGTIDESAVPPVPSPLGLLSLVSFSFDGGSGLLTGVFELTSARQFVDTLIGRIDGLLTQGSFAGGGQLSLDYAIESGTGLFAGAQGFGISQLDFTAPAAAFNAYAEAGVLVFAVPEPSASALAALGLLALLAARRRARR